MRNMLVVVILGILIPSLCHGQNQKVCIAYYPDICKEIVGSEFSTGGDDSPIHYLELDCKTKDGQYVKYIDRAPSIGGVFGIGRLTQPDKIIFRQWNKDELQLKCGGNNERRKIP